MTFDLTAIRAANAQRQARQAAATPGPWLNHHGEFVSQAATYMAICRVNRPVVQDWARGKTVAGPDYLQQANKEFIAAARTDDAPAVIDALAAEVERLRAGIAALHADHDPVWCMAVRGPQLVGAAPPGDWACTCGADRWNAKIAALLDPPEG